MTKTEAYAIGYYYGRAIGNSENLMNEIVEWDLLGQAAKEGYDRGVTDYVMYDEKEVT